MSSHQPTIGVSCGHRVPRVAEVVDGRRLYWCPTCGAHRMSGGKTTGEHGHAYLFQVLELVDEEAPLEFVFPAEPKPHVRRLLATLGVAIVVDADDPDAPRVRSAA